MSRGTDDIASLQTEPVFSLLLKYAVPAIVAMTAASVYNIIDRIFIGRGVGAFAISGLALTFPLMNLSLALGTLVGAGAAAMASIRLGEQRQDVAVRILGNSFVLNLIIGVAYSAFALFFLDDILYMFGASAETLPYAREFMQVILAGNVVTHAYFGLNNIMRVSGFPRRVMFFTLATVGLNLLLAPLFIFVFGWGIRGAALATVLSQLCGMVLVLAHFSDARAGGVRFRRGCFRLEWKIVRDIFSIGMSPFLLHVCASLVALIMNVSLKRYGGDLSIGAYGIIHSVIGMAAMVVFGLNQGMQPIVGYNFGARKYDRAVRAFLLTVAAATAVMAATFAVVELAPRAVASAFTQDAELLSLAERGLRVTFALLPLVGFQMVTSNFFQAIGKAKYAVFLSLSRQVLFLIPALFVLPAFWRLDGVWLATPLSDGLASMLAFVILRMQIRRLRRLENG